MSNPKKKTSGHGPKVDVLLAAEEESAIATSQVPESSLVSDIMATIETLEKSGRTPRKQSKQSIEDEKAPVRMSFELDPLKEYAGGGSVYQTKDNSLPNEIIKRITGPGGDDLVCHIIQARSNHASLFGKPRDNRFDIGFDLLPKDKSVLPKDPEKMEALMKRVEAVKEFLWSCGKGRVRGEQEQPSFSQYLKMITADGLKFGVHATEFLYKDETQPSTPDNFYGFRPVDAGTIYKLKAYAQQDDSFRKAAVQEINNLHRQKVISQNELDGYLKGDYIYSQVISGNIKQFFSSDEMVLHSMYPTTNVELKGYPLTPLDQVIHAVTMHINITMHNKLYFQYGRAARGMLVIKSRSVDEKKLANMRSQFQQTVNSVRHAHRMPVFAVDPQDDISWQAIDNSSRDMEFQYLYDNNIRVILAAFGMSPDELPGYGHLSRGTNSQGLSESNNEYKLLAARDTGIRPLINDLQEHVNKNILTRIDEEVSKYFGFTFCGLDKEDPQKEATRLQQDMQTYASVNDILDRCEKERLPEELGGEVPMNPLYWQTISPYVPVGMIMEHFFKVKGASKDPRFQYIRDGFFFQAKQIEQMDVQSRIQLMMAGMQQQQAPQPGQEQGGQPQEQLQQSEKDFATPNLEFSNLLKKWTS